MHCLHAYPTLIHSVPQLVADLFLMTQKIARAATAACSGFKDWASTTNTQGSSLQFCHFYFGAQFLSLSTDKGVSADIKNRVTLSTVLGEMIFPLHGGRSFLQLFYFWMELEHILD